MSYGGNLYRHRWELLGFGLSIAALIFAAGFDPMTKGGWPELLVVLLLAVLVPVVMEALVPPSTIWRVGSQAFGMAFTIYLAAHVVIGEALPVATWYVVYVIVIYILAALIAYAHVQDA